MGWSGVYQTILTSENVPVSFVSSVLFPTDGKPTKPIRASPTLFTSKPAARSYRKLQMFWPLQCRQLIVCRWA